MAKLEDLYNGLSVLVFPVKINGVPFVGFFWIARWSTDPSIIVIAECRIDEKLVQRRMV